MLWLGVLKRMVLLLLVSSASSVYAFWLIPQPLTTVTISPCVQMVLSLYEESELESNKNKTCDDFGSNSEEYKKCHTKVFLQILEKHLTEIQKQCKNN